MAGHGFETAAVVRAGAMGSGIAQILAQAGLAVLLQDARPGAAEAAAVLLTRLNGRKRLVIGNNDPPAVAALPGWAAPAVHYAEAEVDGTGVVLCHYAFRTWRNAGRGWVNLHGHSHGRLAPMKRQHDVGVDVHGFAPVSLDQLLAAAPRRAVERG